MKQHRPSKLSALTFAVSLAGFLGEPTLLMAKAITASSSHDRPIPAIFVRVYSFPEASLWVLEEAQIEAARILRSASIELRWVNCTTRALSGYCAGTVSSSDLNIRVLAKALPQVHTNALGITGSSERVSLAFIFYDRIAAMRSQIRPIPVMLGRVMAHEIIHLLLPREGHSPFGLMRSQWAVEDLSIGSSTSLGVPAQSVLMMQEEALRRAMLRRKAAAK